MKIFNTKVVKTISTNLQIAGFFQNIERDLEKYRTMMHNMNTVVRANAISNLINNFSEVTNLSNLEGRILIKKNSDGVSTMLGMSTSIQSGFILSDVFGNSPCSILTSIGEDYTGNWMDWIPLKVIGHDSKSLGLYDLVKDDLQCGTVRCILDVTTLMSMYKQYVEYSLNEDIPHSPSKFVYGWVMPNAMESFLNVAIGNIFLSGTFNEPIETELEMLQYANFDKLGEMLLTHAELVKEKTENINYVVKNIPQINGKFVHNMNTQYFATQIVRDFFLMNSIDYIIFLFETSKAENIKLSTETINEIRYQLNVSLFRGSGKRQGMLYDGVLEQLEILEEYL